MFIPIKDLSEAVMLDESIFYEMINKGTVDYKVENGIYYVDSTHIEGHLKIISMLLNQNIITYKLYENDMAMIVAVKEAFIHYDYQIETIQRLGAYTCYLKHLDETIIYTSLYGKYAEYISAVYRALKNVKVTNISLSDFGLENIGLPSTNSRIILDDKTITLYIIKLLNEKLKEKYYIDINMIEIIKNETDKKSKRFISHISTLCYQVNDNIQTN